MIYYKKKIQQDVGATAIEYGLIASLIGVLAVSGMSAIGVNLSNTYCTVSKYLGGSGTCSGATSSSADSNGSTGGSESTSGNSSAGSSTGGVDSTNSLEKGATIAQIEAGLQEELGTTFVPKIYGGNDYAGEETFKEWEGSEVSTLAKDLSDINATDPVTNVFGAYDTLNSNKPVTDYNTVLADLQNGGATIQTGSTSDGHSIEVTTASGKVYTLHAEAYSDGKVTQTENAPLD
ncbi:hypothetical protein MSKU15_2477 [Komagataeibacter diospyri]|uniref:Flp family type IVb pilin n=1 Tax=Komagataeibacter diospyri TaxID=1932662 RepID=UPI00113F2A0F|nr:hypothetical protein [Komagataeibacter diospyri]GCE90876.1 hypothetical protein MSKU15_2477 [Komagataeibacter diospyri]